MKNFTKKPTVLIVLIYILSAYSGWAQKGAYISVNSGYALSMSTQTFYGNSKSTDNSYFEEQVYVSLGKGVNFGGAFGYMFNQNIGAELGVSYLISDDVSIKSIGDYSGSSYTYETTLSAKMIQFKPTLIFSSGLGKLNPYVKLGAVIGKGKITSVSDSKDSYIYPGEPIENYTMHQKNELNGGLSFGLSAALGINLPLSDKIGFFLELNMINMAYAPTKGEVTEATENGVNVLPDYPISDKKTEYVDSYSYNYSNPPKPYNPGKELKQKAPFGSVGTNLGVRFKF